jgi:Protein of unknown function (DUF2726)
MNQIAGWGLAAMAAMAGVAVGVFLCVWWTQRAARERKRIPKQWPLNPRVLANSEERKVWRWLCRAFYDHHVMIKTPVTRFTLPRTKEEGRDWFKVLNGVYCTFTVCAADGHVIGCVDVPGRNGISRSQRQLKQTLLSQCGIAYWVVKPTSLPTLAEIRTEFLGELASMTRDRERDEAMITAARLNLRAAIDRQRHNRPADSGLNTSRISHAGPESSQLADSNTSSFNAGWPQENSFLTPLDSRRGELR